MSLVNLLQNSNSFHTQGSKSIKYGENTGGQKGEKDIPSYHLFPRITWFSDDMPDSIRQAADPIFSFGSDHTNGSLDGGGFRGGAQVFEDRKDLDIKRIRNFLGSDQGSAFKRRQVALQALNNHANPGQRVFNFGANLKAQILASGLSHIKRAGALPIPAIEERLNEGGRGGNLGMILEADYISYQKHKEYLREERYSLGDPGARPSGNNKLLKVLFGNVEEGPKKRREWSPKFEERENLVDKVNAARVYRTINGFEPSLLDNLEDFIKFKFEVIDSQNPSKSDVILFRAFLDTMGDSFNAAHNEVKYNGRGESFYTYNSFKRTVNLSFKIAAQTRYEMRPLYQKLNYLVAQTAPNYSSTGRIRTPYMRITVGDYFYRVPGVVNSVSIDWQKDYPWEIALEPEGRDFNMKQLPHVLDVNLGFTPIHSFTPNNNINTPFISIGTHQSNDPKTRLQMFDSWIGPGKTSDMDNNTLPFIPGDNPECTILSIDGKTISKGDIEEFDL